MESFKDYYLTEKFREPPAHSDDVWERIGSLDIPISTPMLKRVFGKNPPRIKAIHTLGTEQIENLLELEGKKKSISATTRFNGRIEGNWYEGALIVSVVEGDFLVGGGQDIWSMPDMQGRRWLSTDTIERLSPRGDTWVSMLMLKLKDMVLKGTGVSSLREAEGFPKLKAKIIKVYYDSVEKLIKEYSKEFSEVLLKSHEFSGVDEYNEVLLNNIEVKKFFIIPSSATAAKYHDNAKKKDVLEYLKDKFIESKKIRSKFDKKKFEFVSTFNGIDFEKELK